jgi:type IV secretion system protein VirB9
MTHIPLSRFVGGILMLVLFLGLGACATVPETPPAASTPPARSAVEVKPAAEPAKLQVVAIPQPLPLPGQLKPVVAGPGKVPEPADPHQRVAEANEDARVGPSREGFINAIQVWPYAEGALYQVYASPGRVSDIMLQAGEHLISVSAGDTVRWIVGDTTSAIGTAKRVHVLVKPIRADLQTNLVITTDRRLYLIELSSTEATWMASVSWSYPQDELMALRGHAEAVEAARPVAQGIAVDKLHFGYTVSGDTPAWRPLRAFDDGQHVYIQFPPGIGQAELPPVFVVGVAGDAELVNYRYRAPYYIVDRLFRSAELRLGGDKAQVVRITRTAPATAGAGS